MGFEVTKIGERGQVVIPQEFREHMRLQKGDKFIVIEQEDMLILKKLKEPTIENFEVMIKKGHAHAKKHALTEKELNEALQKARHDK